MKINEFIKKELSNWNWFELISLTAVLSIIFFNAHINHDSIIAVMSATCGILYTIFAGKGKISCYFFGILGSAFYIYLAFFNKLFGNLILYLGYYLPMEIIGIFKWKNHLKEDSNEIKKTQLTLKERIYYLAVTVLAVILLDIFLIKIGGKNHTLDSITTVLSIVGMYLTVKRCIEQWVVWFAVNLIEIIIWTNILLSGQKVYATIIMWGFYLILSVYFFTRWQTELKNNL